MNPVNSAPHANGPHATSHFESWAYGLLALPLAFVALPMYVNVPHFYASQFTVPLSLLGAVLLFSRLVDAFTDPLLGRLSDVLYARSRAVVMSAVAVFSLFLALSFAALFHPPKQSSTTLLLAWVALWVTLCHLAYSMLSILHQAWATRLGGGAVSQSRVLAWRESAGLAGVAVCAEAGTAMAAIKAAAITRCETPKRCETPNRCEKSSKAMWLPLGYGLLADVRCPRPGRNVAPQTRQSPLFRW